METTDYELLRHSAVAAAQIAINRTHDFRQYCNETDRLAKSKAQTALQLIVAGSRMLEELEGLGAFPSVENITPRATNILQCHSDD